MPTKPCFDSMAFSFYLDGMFSKMLSYGVAGFFLGAILGAIVGLTTLGQVKKSQRETALPISVVLFSVGFAVAGAGIGANMGKNSYIEERTGISNPTVDGYKQEGRYWVGVTKWIDKRDNKEYRIATGRNTILKNTVSTIDDTVFVIHDTTSASKQTIEKYHTAARNHCFKLIKENFTEEPMDVEKIVPAVQSQHVPKEMFR